MRCVTGMGDSGNKDALSAIANNDVLRVTVNEDDPKATASQINTAIDRLSDSEKIATLEKSPPLVSCP